MTIIERSEGIFRPKVAVLGPAVDRYVEVRMIQAQEKEQEIFDSESLRISVLNRFSAEPSSLDSHFPRASRSIATDRFGTVVMNIVSVDPENGPVIVNFDQNGDRISLSLIKDVSPRAIKKYREQRPKDTSVSHEIFAQLVESINISQTVQA